MKIKDTQYLGKLCPRKHEWENTGKSMLFKSSMCCVACGLISTKAFYQRKKKDAKWMKANKEKNKLYMKNYLNNGGREYRKEARKEASKEQRKLLTDSYIKSLLCKRRNGNGLNHADVPDSLVQAKREMIKLRRALGLTWQASIL
jgi:hypothetical protein